MTIVLDKLEIQNFKCHRHLVITPAGESVAIHGNNGSGKSSIYDAFTWLLFGRDSSGKGEKVINIKPLNAAGEVLDHNAITSVEATLRVDGEPLLLYRGLREKWSNRRGCAETVFDGNVSDYAIDGVSVKKNGFDEKIKELCDEGLFKMLTAVSYFANDMRWQDRRAALFEMAGICNDAFLMRTEERFQVLAESLGRLTLDTYKDKLTAQRRQLTGVRDDIPSRLNELQRMLDSLAGLDFTAANRAEQKAIQQADSIRQKMQEAQDADAIRGIDLDIRKAEMDLQALEAENRAFLQQQTVGGDAAKKRADELRRLIQTNQATITRCQRDKERLTIDIERLRKKWIDVNGQAFTGGNCPTCGQAIPYEQLKAKTAEFERQKAAELSQIEEAAGLDAKDITDISTVEQDAKTAIQACDAELQTAMAEITNVTAVDMPGYADGRTELEEKLRALREQRLRILMAGKSAAAAYQTELDACMAAASDARRIAAKEGIYNDCIQRMNLLREEQRNAAAAIEGVERMLCLIEDFTRYKASYVEESINGMFAVAKFRLFREQNNGGLEDRCDVVVDGVPYSDLNNATKINVGIDIANTISRHYGVSVPLFIDNAESVVQLANCDMQVIRLVVDGNYKEVTIV